jgi:hypothetical protein
MPLAPDAAALAELLPGTWRVGATNFPLWLSGDRHRPRFNYELKTADPLVLHDTVTYTTAQGVEKTLPGVDRLRTDRPRRNQRKGDQHDVDQHGGNIFVWRGTGLLRFVTSRWAVVGATEDSNVMVIRFVKSRLTPAGVDVVLREGTDSHAFRTQVTGLSSTLGLTHGELASLTWLEFTD